MPALHIYGKEYPLQTTSISPSLAVKVNGSNYYLPLDTTRPSVSSLAVNIYGTTYYPKTYSEVGQLAILEWRTGGDLAVIPLGYVYCAPGDWIEVDVNSDTESQSLRILNQNGTLEVYQTGSGTLPYTINGSEVVFHGVNQLDGFFDSTQTGYVSLGSYSMPVKLYFYKESQYASDIHTVVL